MNKKGRTFSLPTILVGLFFLAAYFAAMFTVCHFARIYELEAAEAYATRGGSGEANFLITQEWRGKVETLGLYSHIVFGALLILAVIAFFLLIKFAKEDRKMVARESFSFLKFFFAMTIADIALMFTLGNYVSFTRDSTRILEYMVYTSECLIIVELVSVFFDRLSYKKRGFSILFDHIGKKETIYMWVAFVSTLILGVVFLLTLLGWSEPFMFAFFAFVALPYMIALEIAFFTINGINYFSKPKAEEIPAESKE